MTDTARIQETIRMILAPGKGILAADESSQTIKKRFDAIGIESTEENRRGYRNMLFGAPGYEQYISGVILFDETVDQKDDSGTMFSKAISDRGVAPGIKTDEGKEEHPSFSPQTVTRGLKGLGKRLEEYTERSSGTLRFTKWRQVILVDPAPTEGFLDYVMNVMAEQAAWSVAAGYVPICEPEVLMEGTHSAEECHSVTERTLHTLFAKLAEHGVDPRHTLLKTNMVLSGRKTKMDTPDEVGPATVGAFQASCPDTLPGIVFLSGGQTSVQATENLNACALSAKETSAPWVLTFSYGRALQDDALKTWAGESANNTAAQAALLKRAKCNSAAQKGGYTSAMEEE